MQKTTATQRVNDNNIVEQYGERISDILGVDLIKSIKEVSSESLRLGSDDAPYIHKLGNHPLLKEHIVVRGTLSKKRKFIAVKIDVLNESHKHIYTVTEIIFQLGFNEKNTYFISYDVTTDSGEECNSLLYENSRYLNDADLGNLKQMLMRKTVKVAREESRLIKLNHFQEIVEKIPNTLLPENKKDVLRDFKKILTGENPKVALQGISSEKLFFFRGIFKKISHAFLAKDKRTVILRKHIPPLKLNRKAYIDCKITCINY